MNIVTDKENSWENYPTGTEWAANHPSADSIESKAAKLFSALLDQLRNCTKSKVVIAISGGSGVGKSTTANLIHQYLENLGIGCALIGGDEYPCVSQFRTTLNDCEFCVRQGSKECCQTVSLMISRGKN